MKIGIKDVREMLECGTATNMELTEAVEFLLRERRALGREVISLKIAHLRRMAEASAEIVGNWPSILASIPPEHADANCWRARWIRRHAALQSACLAKIAELKEVQCSTKS